MDELLEFEPILPKDRSIPIGCIGSGFIMADCHLVAYREVGFNPVAIASADPEQARATARRHGLKRVYESVDALLEDPEVEVLDIAVPPDVQLEIIRKVADRRGRIRAVLAQKPLAGNLRDAAEAVGLCRAAGISLAVNQNMRYDQSVRACHTLLKTGRLGEPVLGTIEMRAIPHWMPWQERQGWCTFRIMSIHHLDTFRFWFGDPDRILASARPDPRTRFPHRDGITLYVLEYDTSGLRAAAWDDVWTGPAREGAGKDIYIRWRVEGTRGLAVGTIGWPDYPARKPSTLDFTTVDDKGKWLRPRWDKVWFPDAFAGPMSELLVALEAGMEPSLSGTANLGTMALVDAAYRSAETHSAVSPAALLEEVRL